MSMLTTKEGNLDAESSTLPPLLDASPRKPHTFEPHAFEGVEKMSKIIDAQCLKLQEGTSREQYICFQPVTVSQLAEIDREPNQIGKDVRIRFYTDQSLLIVKLMPCALHETSHSNFASIILFKCIAMRSTLLGEVSLVGATRYRGADGTFKEGDSALKPVPPRDGGRSWPTVMIEAGCSESLDHLRMDAAWWLEQSRGEITIVIIISIICGGRQFHLEEWELNRQRTARSFQTIDIYLDSSVVTGSPLVLEFEKVFLRPCERIEQNIVFNDEDLLSWAKQVWVSAR